MTLGCVRQRKVFTTPLLTEAKSCRNTEQFTKKKSHCQRGGVRGVANQNAPSKQSNMAKPKDAPMTKPWLCVKPMLHDQTTIFRVSRERRYDTMDRSFAATQWKPSQPAVAQLIWRGRSHKCRKRPPEARPPVRFRTRGVAQRRDPTSA